MKILVQFTLYVFFYYYKNKDEKLYLRLIRQENFFWKINTRRIFKKKKITLFLSQKI